MRKKYLSALLFGALLFASTGTFTSCKDYDDDIDNLQEQIDGLATKSDMESKLTQMQTALSSAQSDAQSALSQAQQALQAAQAANNDEEVAKLQQDIEALEKRVKALEDAAIDVEALKAEISAAVESQITEFRTEMAALIEQVEGLVGEVADMVTDVDLLVSYSGFDEDGVEGDGRYCNEESVLSFGTITEQDNVFGKGLDGEITFTKGTQVQLEDYFLIRVSPTSAVIDASMISLQNSKGDKLDDMVEVTKVERYTGLMSRAASDNGLWKVSVKLKSYDEKAFEAVAKTKVDNRTENVLYAVAINNTKSSETASARQVISSYDLSLDWDEKDMLNELSFKVNDVDVAEIRNRYDASEAGTEAKVDELKWKGEAATAAITEGSKINVTPDADDDRCDNAVGSVFTNSTATYKLLPVEQGKPFTIKLTGEDLSSVRAIYVTRDDENAVESAPSEINAWKSYSYEGLNTVVEGTETTVTINASSAINDIIGFRVYAVNYDGTLLDPDGKAFYVVVGNQAVNLDATNTTIIPDADQDTLPTEEESAKENVTMSKFDTAVTLEWKTDKIGKNEDVFTAYFIGKDGKSVMFSTNSIDVSDVKFEEVTKVYTQPNIDDWKKYEDDKTYSGTLTIKDANGGVLATKTVTMTKKLPTALPEGFSIKTAQVVDGIYNCYLIPDTWTADAATEGTMKMTEVFNFGKGIESQYEITFATSMRDEKDEKDIDNPVTGDGTLAVAKDYIDNETEHATKVEYNYGKISSQKNDKDEYEDYKVEATTFNTIYNCIYNDTYTWAWATNDQLANSGVEDLKVYGDKEKDGSYTNATPSTTLTYGEDFTPALPDGNPMWYDSAIYGTSAWDSRYSALLSRPYESSLIIKDATLTSDANGEEEYFDVTVEKGHITKFVAIKLSSTTNPTADVASTLTIKAKDMYGHDVEIKLPMTVKKR